MAADDARERLRRYLEQRRELGDTELVLDSMDVNDVMRLLGAGAGATSAPAGQAGPTRRQDATSATSDTPAIPRAPRDEASFGGDSDWRTALRAAGAAPTSGPAKPKVPMKEAPAPIEAPAPQPAPALPESPMVSEPPATGEGGIVIGGSTGALIPPSIAGLASLQDVAEATRGCTRCPLYATATNAVPGEGNPNADFMIVGEAPGATEDETGRPFVGAAGQLLTKIIGAINLTREDVFIANVLKHRPPGNRNPKPDEVAACSPYLLRQIELVQPKVILALGTFAAQTLLETKTAIGKLRGQVHQYHGVPLIVTYHPAALLRNPAWKRPTWEDVQLARRVLDSATGA